MEYSILPEADGTASLNYKYNDKWLPLIDGETGRILAFDRYETIQARHHRGRIYKIAQAMDRLTT